jgi:hypothetical protein
MSRDGIRAFCDKHGREIVDEVGHTYYVQGHDPGVRLTRAYVRAMSALSFGRLPWRPRRHLRRRPLPKPHRRWSTGDDPAQHRHQPAARRRPRQHRESPAPQR